MRKLVATIAAALALGGVGLATHAATSDAPADASDTIAVPIYIAVGSVGEFLVIIA